MKILPLSISYCSKANKDNKINNIISHSPSFYGNFPPVCYYPPAGIKSGSFSPKDFLEDIKYDNSEAFLRNTETGKEELQPNAPAIKKLKALDNLTLLEKKAFVNEFCAMTGFPNFKKVKENMESEFKGALLSLGENEGFKTLFIGYDKNCSLGRGQAFPGSDADALFAIIDDRHQPYSWYAGKIRWDVKDIINQRILCTHAGGLPEVLSINFINQGLDMADCAFKKADFSEEDLKRFGTNLKNDSNNFVSAAEFNIRMAKQLPKRGDVRDTFYKTAAEGAETTVYKFCFTLNLKRKNGEKYLQDCPGMKSKPKWKASCLISQSMNNLKSSLHDEPVLQTYTRKNHNL